ncbi:MAG: hypothetical protein KC492_35560, partial [Myxococcales bacterium]|nr:hypothetical protein [Myxococcales bacterium]
MVKVLRAPFGGGAFASLTSSASTSPPQAGNVNNTNNARNPPPSPRIRNSPRQAYSAAGAR